MGCFSFSQNKIGAVSFSAGWLVIHQSCWYGKTDPIKQFYKITPDSILVGYWADVLIQEQFS